MKNVPVVDRVRFDQSAAYASEMDYAAAMHFNAAHLPGGTSSSLTTESAVSTNDAPAQRKPVYIPQRQVYQN